MPREKRGKEKGHVAAILQRDVHPAEQNEPLYRETYVPLPFPVWTQEQQQKADQANKGAASRPSQMEGLGLACGWVELHMS